MRAIVVVSVLLSLEASALPNTSPLRNLAGKISDEKWHQTVPTF
jgi:hypothetical protein